MIESFLVECVIHFGDHVVAAGGTEKGEPHIPEGETSAQLEGLSGAHQLLQRVDDQHVDDGHVDGVVPVGFHPLQAWVELPVQEGKGGLPFLVHQRLVARQSHSCEKGLLERGKRGTLGSWPVNGALGAGPLSPFTGCLVGGGDGGVLEHAVSHSHLRECHKRDVATGESSCPTEYGHWRSNSASMTAPLPSVLVILFFK